MSKEIHYLDVNSVSSPSLLLSLSPSTIFILFNDLSYQLFDIIWRKKLCSGRLYNEAKHVLPFTSEEIVYYSVDEEIIVVFNLYEGKKVNSFSTVPTSKCLAASERTPFNVKTIIDEGSMMLTLTESQMVVLLEQRSAIFNSHETIVTAFKREKEEKRKKSEDFPMSFYEKGGGKSFAQVSYNNPTQKNLILTNINSKDLICICGTSFEFDPLDFYIWDLSLKEPGFQLIRLESTILNIQIIGVLPFSQIILPPDEKEEDEKENFVEKKDKQLQPVANGRKIGLLGNLNNGSTPILLCVDIDQAKVTAGHRLKTVGKNWMVSFCLNQLIGKKYKPIENNNNMNTLDLDQLNGNDDANMKRKVEEGRIFLVKTWKEGMEIVIFEPKERKVELVDKVEVEQGFIEFFGSVDGEYVVGWERKFVEETIKEMKITLYRSLPSRKLHALYLIEKTGLCKNFGDLMIGEVLDFLK